MPHSEEGQEVPMSSPQAVKDEPMEDSGAIPSSVAAAANGNDVDMKDSAQETKRDDVKLEELFADMDSDDEFSSSAPAPHPTASSPVASGELPTSDILSMKASDPEIMRSFYQRLFPWRYLFQWLNHGPTPTNDFCHREFAFTLQNESYMRHKSYANGDLLKKEVIQLIPKRFEIGAIYNLNPRDKKQMRDPSKFQPLGKELCFDIDLTDYDEIRTCCSGTDICNKCWQFITMAIRVVDVAFREDFGFKHIMWVYSGRRGAHAWVCDKKARNLDNQKRRAIVGYLEVIAGGAQGGKKVNVRRPLHPHLSRSLETLKSHFQEDILEAQDPWNSEEQANKLLQLLPDRILNESLKRKWDAAPGRASSSKWADINAVAKTGGASKNLDTKALQEAKQDIVLEYTYPRLDVNVSKRVDHLLKTPFAVHPGTGRVCVPIDAKAPEEFDPFEVPTVQELLTEIDSWKAPEGDEEAKNVADWEKTNLKPYIEQFRHFINALLKDETEGVRVKREREGDGMSF